MFKSYIVSILGIAFLFILKESDSLPLKENFDSGNSLKTTALTLEPTEDTTVMRLFPMQAGNSTIEKVNPRTLEKQAEGEEGGEGGGGEGGGGEGGGGEEGGGAGGGEGGGGEGGGEGGGGEGGGAAGGGAAGGGAAGGGAAGGGDGGDKTTQHIVPKFTKDPMGNWVRNVWGATFGNVWKDTRFVGQRTQQRIKVDSNAVTNYYPGEELSTVCMDASTIYNIPGVKKWLVRKIYKSPIKQRPIWHALRYQIYKQGNSEECHDLKKYPNAKDYLECAVRRDMRLESLIPMYPMHQLGWGF